ncbi:anti-phage defense-associated sirtuin Dsr1 [Pseudomonas sp. M20]|uniref:anti-phage defense-associated sirtuin Dsr1 n=1 Tax=Pseudomonas sp. M20 TaxID=3379129 RepID=UPI0038657529
MQFVINGPEIPSELLQAHEEGRVVFFCGAGISYPADLPGFDGLVTKIYENTGTSFSDIEKLAFQKKQFDATLDLLERRLPGQRLALREALAQSLKPNLRLRGATRTHEALLRLARNRQGVLRLVTTNFDRIFDAAGKRSNQKFIEHSAPMLPIPKSSRWDGLVYLHGVLPKRADTAALNRLVVTSGDFGLAYLTERWAARFVSELFRNYVVCFVGYSINDPVLRYMMDALAADRMLGEATPTAWAFADYNPGRENEKTIEWESKGVSPILYEVPTDSFDHSALHETLHAWGNTYRDGVTGKERIIVSHALARPSASTREDNFVGRMLWALSDMSGLPARQFAEFNPVPSLDWLLDAYSPANFKYKDLKQFGVSPNDKPDEKLKFSIVARPTPYTLAPLMTFATGGSESLRLDPVMFQLGRWLVRHLDDPVLVIWIAQQGGQLHSQMVSLVEDQLGLIARLERERKMVELDEIRSGAPKAIPRPVMRVLWRLILGGWVKGSQHQLDLYLWVDRLKRDGLTATARIELRKLLAPRLAIRKSWRWDSEEDLELNSEEVRLTDLVSCEVVLVSDHVQSTLGDLASEQWMTSLPLLFYDLQQNLRDTLDLYSELGEASEQYDRSHWDMPSITPHWQNRNHHEWTVVIELLRDSWIAVSNADKSAAAKLALLWFELPYPTFKRLALFAASNSTAIPPSVWISWLSRDEGYWLWSEQTKRESLRLLVLQAKQLNRSERTILENIILSGPPRLMFRSELSAVSWGEVVDECVWLYLSKLKESGLALSKVAKKRLNDLCSANVEWRIAPHERDEFSHWMSGTGDPDYEFSREVDIAPVKRKELVIWLRQKPAADRTRGEDTWREVCSKHLLNALFSLEDLAAEDFWPVQRWREAFQVWSEGRKVSRSWHHGAVLVSRMPGNILKEVAIPLCRWLDAVSKTNIRDDRVLIVLCNRLIEIFNTSEANKDQAEGHNHESVVEAINNPLGNVAQIIINIWFKRQPGDNDNLPLDLLPIFSELCNPKSHQCRHARVILAANLIALFRVDRSWTEIYLIPFLDWERYPDEAKGTWEGFLWSPRLHQNLLIAIKPYFLDTAKHYSSLESHAQQFAIFLTYAALGPIEGYTKTEFRSAIAELPVSGLEQSAQALYQALEGAGNQREDYWKNRIQPFWQGIWPKSRDLATLAIAGSLARMSLAAGTEFPAALAAVRDWLRPLPHAHYLIKKLSESGLCSTFPDSALSILGLVIDSESWPPLELGACLDQIVNSDESLRSDQCYRRLHEIFRRQRG